MRMARRGTARRILDGLTDSQREAVCHGEGPLLVVAGAGTGKTRVITRRIAYLLDQGVPPDRVIAVTFTNKAADEMRRRVEALVGSDVYVSTFHSFCARLLREHAHRLGRDGSFTIYDRSDSLRIVRQVIRERELDPDTFPPRDVLDYIALRKERVERPPECVERALGIVEQTYALAYQEYEERLARNNALDFDDLLLKTLDLFSDCPDVLGRLQETYLHVLVDEYQDTNLPQHVIARALQGRHHNITAVGDPDQVIYTWRGARLENLLEFEQDFPGARVVTLERNYRSSGVILRAATACIRNNRMRMDKVLRTDRPDGRPIVVGEFEDPFAEGRWVAKKVSELLAEGVRPSDIAVFYRTKQQSLPLEDAFAASALPHQVVDSVGFFDRREVKDLRAYLQLLVNPRDDESCQRIINVPPRGIGQKTLAALSAEARARGEALIEAARRAQQIESLSPRAKSAVARFWRLYEKLSAVEPTPVANLIRKLVELTDYVNRQPAEERADAQEVVDMFIGYARQYDERRPDGGLIGFLEQAALVSDVDGWNAQAGAVPLMTLHSAKGLEFDAVFLVGLEEDMLPHRRALEENPHGDKDAALEEERRLFYVGMTRARHRLFVSRACRRVVRGREEAVVPSRFLAELPPDCLVTEGAGGPAGGSGGFQQELQSILKKKRSTLRLLDGAGPDGLERGMRVRHPKYGEGRVLEVGTFGRRRMIKVNFQGGTTVTLLLAQDQIANG